MIAVPEHLPKAMFFDWDGTLVDSVDFIRNAHNAARSQLAMPALSAEDFKPFFGMPRAILYEKLYGEQAGQARQYFDEYVQANHIKDIKTAPGAGELVEWLASTGIKAGVVSNKKSEFIKAEILNFGWDQVFEIVIGSGDCAKDKPAPEPLLSAINQTQTHDLEAHEIWYIGDTQTDQMCAYQAGYPFIFIGHKGVEQALNAQYPPLMTFKSCHDFLQRLLQLHKK